MEILRNELKLTKITDDAEDVLTLERIEVKEHLPEVCIVEIPSIVLVIETGLGYYTYPMLVIETKMNAEVRDWSSEVKAIGFVASNVS